MEQSTQPDEQMRFDPSLPDVIPDNPWINSLRKVRRSPMTMIGVVMCLMIIFLAAFAPLVAPYPEDAGRVVKFKQRLQAPSQEHWFGTDMVGRDVLSRVLVGSRISLIMAISVLLASTLIGVPLGLVAAYWGGPLETVIMRVNEIFLAIPSLVFVLVVSALAGPSLIMSIFAISLAWWTWYARLTYGEVISIKKEQFVEAAVTSGASKLRIAFSEILPNIYGLIIVKATLDLGYVILLGAALGFLGLGVQPPAPEWGVMIADGREQLPDAWWLTLFPGLAIYVSVVGFNLLGDGLRDILGAGE